MNITFIIIIIIFLVGGFKRAYELRNHPDEDDENSYTEPPRTTEQSIQPPEGYLIYEGSQLNIPRTNVHDILIMHCPYYLPLLPHLKTKFLIRLMHFMEVKMFVLPKETRFKEMPVLASAAAVQLTFGLHHFLLPSFQFIFSDNNKAFFANKIPFSVSKLEYSEAIFEYELTMFSLVDFVVIFFKIESITCSLDLFWAIELISCKRKKEKIIFFIKHCLRHLYNFYQAE